jgi:hypothetical protein
MHIFVCFGFGLLATVPTHLQAIYSGAAPGPGSYYYDGPDLAQPTVLTSENGVLNIQMTVDIARFNGFISFNSRQFYVNGVAAIPGPTWSVYPGDTVTVTLTNNLGANYEATASTDYYYMNVMHGANTTNIHTHGLHVDPSIDDVMIEVEPGKSWTYKYQIPSGKYLGLIGNVNLVLSKTTRLVFIGTTATNTALLRCR